MNDGAKAVRVKACHFLKTLDIKRLVFIDEASIREQEKGRNRAWRRPNETRHPDIKGSTRDKGYSCGQFLGAIKYGEPAGPYAIIELETEKEKKEAI